MPARTSSVVALGMISLSVIGVVSIFGNAILAVVAPGGEPTPSVTAPPAASKTPPAAAPAPPTLPVAAPAKDGSS